MFKIRIPQTTKSLKLALLIIFTCVFLSASVFPVSSQTLEEIEDEIEDKQEELFMPTDPRLISVQRKGDTQDGSF